jgi:putative flippase GtrA
MPCGQPSNLSFHVATQPDTVTERASALSDAAGGALRRRANWLQLAKFCVVGATGYVVNLAVFATLVHAADMHYIPAAVCSFLVAVTNNYVWNRLWTFRHQRGHIAYQGLRFLLVSSIALAANLLFLAILVGLGVPKIPAQAIAIALVTPWNFVANKLWSFRRQPAV